MQMLTFFGTLSLIFLPRFAFSSDEKLSQDQQCIQPIEYIMNISAEVHNNSLNVNSRVKLNISCTDQKIRLYVKHYCNVIYDFNIITNISRYNYSHWLYEPLSTKEGFIDIVLKDQYIEDFKIKQRKKDIQPGIYWITAKYNCILEKVATIIPYVPETKKEKYLILPRIPAEWIFPYWKNPAIKAAFTIQFNHTYNEIVLSHTVGDKKIKTNQFYTLFPTTPKISTHLVATAVLPEYTDESTYTDYYMSASLLHYTRATIKIRLQVQNDISYAILLIKNFLTSIDEKKEYITSVSYVQYLILPNSNNYETIVTSGLVFFRDASIAYNRKVDSIIKQAKVTCLIVRGVLQEMFSEWLVTLKQSDFWFLEGFLTFYGVYLVDQIYNETLLKSIAIQTRRVGFEYTEAFIEHGLPIQNNLFPQNVTLNIMWKEKAFNIFSMINTLCYDKEVLYNSIFKEAIKLYSTMNTSSDTFNEQSVLDILWKNILDVPAIYKNIRLETINIKNVITFWITQNGYPVIQVTRDNDTQSLAIKLIDCIAVNQEELCEHMWWIPVTYVKISRNVSTRTYVHLKPDGKSIFVPYIKENDFIIITDQNGYRVTYDYKSWTNIAFFLENKNHTIWDPYEVSDVTLAQILDDAFYFLIQNTKYNEQPVAGMSNIDTFFNLAGNVLYVKNGYITWYPIFNALQYVSQIFPFPESAKIKDKTIEILNKFLEDTSHINVSENSIDTQLYHEALKWTCILGSSKCNEHLTDILKWHLQNPAQNKLLVSWKRWIYCQGVALRIISDFMLLHTIRNIYLSQEKHNQFFQLLFCRGHNYKLEVRYAQEHHLGEESDFVNLLFDIVARHVKKFSSLDIIIRQIQDKFPRPVGLLAVVNFSINHIYVDEDLETITKTVLVMVTNFINRYNLETPLFIHDVIRKKMVKRRRIIRTKKIFIRNVPHYSLHY